MSLGGDKGASKKQRFGGGVDKGDGWPQQRVIELERNGRGERKYAHRAEKTEDSSCDPGFEYDRAPGHHEDQSCGYRRGERGIAVY